MASTPFPADAHAHLFLGRGHSRNERRVWLVIALTGLMMVGEIVAGTLYGSMALLADGWHMATHAGALLIAALAYLYARRHAHDPRFSFGTGKLGDLAGFASAVVLALVAVLIGWESVGRLAAPVPVRFEEAILVAVLGLAVNLACAWLLREDRHHHDDRHRHRHDHPGRDNNLRAAYVHVLADALTSILAIAALLLGRNFGWVWADPLIGIVGALVIARWSWGLIRESGGVLLDAAPHARELRHDIHEALEGQGDRIADLHVWQVGPGHYAAIVALVSPHPREPAHYKGRLAHLRALSHLTVEVQPSASLSPA